MPRTKEVYWFDASVFFYNPLRLPENIEEILEESVQDVSEVAGFQGVLHLSENQAAAMKAAIERHNSKMSTYQIKFWQTTPEHPGQAGWYRPSVETIQEHYIRNERVPARV